MAGVSLKSIYKSYGRNAVISDLNLDIADGEFMTLLGPSGCGKTTLLRMIAGLEDIDRGELLIGEKRFNAIPAQRRPIAMVFQSYALFPHLSITDNILFGLRIKKVPAPQQRAKLIWAIDLLGLSGLEKRLPREVSGGQRQRVALARALVLDPDVLLLDEPLSNLDATLRDTATEELKRIHNQVGKTIIYVTHNQVEAMTMSGRIALIDQGSIRQCDTPRTIYDSPTSVFAAEFIGSPAMNMIAGEISRIDSVVGIKSSIGFLVLDGARSPLIHSRIGAAVKVGIRPQNILLVKQNATRRASDSIISLRVELVETMGDRSLVIGRTDQKAVVRFLVNRDEDFSISEELKVAVDGRRVHLFDPTTGRNILV